MFIPLLRRLNQAGRDEGSRFWIGQFLAATFTIIGVFLAAYMGYKRAVEYDQLLLAQDRYYLLSTLYEEIKDNLDKLDHIIEDIERPWVNEVTLENYFWQHAPKNAQTFKLPTRIMVGTQRFYRKSNALLKRINYGSQKRVDIAKQLAELAQNYRQSVVPRIEAEITALYSRVNKGGIQLDRTIDF